MFTITTQILMGLYMSAGVLGMSTRRGKARALRQGTSWSLLAWGYTDKIENSQMVDVDFMTISADDIAEIKSVETVDSVVCYVSAGTAEEWRADYQRLKPFISSNSRYHLEDWLDITQWKNLKPVMEARLKSARSKGCDAIEFDNVDCYLFAGKCVRGETTKSLKKFQVAYLKWLAEATHDLGMLIGLKNAVSLIPELIDDFDFAVNESCSKYSRWHECASYQPFVEQDKAVFGVEWNTKGSCKEAKDEGIVRKYRSGNRWKDC